MYVLYKITNSISLREYGGMTKVGLDKRWKQHVQSSRTRTTPLAAAIKKYGPECFTRCVVETFEEKTRCEEAERELIRKLENPYNLAPGGEGGFVVTDTDAWKEKLRAARVGRQPALGMKHTEENKKFFSVCAQKKPLKFSGALPDTFKEARDEFGISKTHYYRLIKRTATNDGC